MNALIVTDMQNDFLPGGALAVPRGDEVVEVANRMMEKFELVLATQDWHGPDHLSFAVNHPGHQVGDVIRLEGGLEQILWPVHCVRETWGADFAPALHRWRIQRVFHKATEPDIDSYSTFFDNMHRRSTGLAEFLHQQGVTDLFILGLAMDYCIQYSVLDGLAQGFRMNVIEDGCRGIELHEGDVLRAIEEMQRAGAILTRSELVLAAPAAKL